jgi:hypothetical protein
LVDNIRPMPMALIRLSIEKPGGPCWLGFDKSVTRDSGRGA